MVFRSALRGGLDVQILVEEILRVVEGLYPRQTRICLAGIGGGDTGRAGLAQEVAIGSAAERRERSPGRLSHLLDLLHRRIGGRKRGYNDKRLVLTVSERSRLRVNARHRPSKTADLRDGRACLPIMGGHDLNDLRAKRPHKPIVSHHLERWR